MFPRWTFYFKSYFKFPEDQKCFIKYNNDIWPTGGSNTASLCPVCLTWRRRRLLRNHIATSDEAHEDVSLYMKIESFNDSFVKRSTLKSLFSPWERDKCEMADFSSLGLSDWLVKQCKQLGINKPTPVQENCVPAILQGKVNTEKQIF